MAALNFPSSPTLGQTHTENGKVWVWTGYAWVTEATGLTANDIGVTVQGYDADISTVSASQAEMEAGTESALRSMSPLRVKQAIDALAPPVTISDSTSIDLTLTGQQISAAAIFGTTSGTVAEGNHAHASLYQPLDADLTAIAGLSGTTGLLKKTAANTWSLDTTAYTTNLGTVTSVSGTGTVKGLTLTGTVTSSGSLTLGGTLDLSSPPAIGGTTPAAGTFTTLGATGNVTLGDASGDTLTINGTAVSCPNNLNFDSDTLFIDAANNRVGIGTNAPTRLLTLFSGVSQNPVRISNGADLANWPTKSEYAVVIESYGSTGTSGLNGSSSGLNVQAGFNRGVPIAQFSSITTAYAEVPRLTILDAGNVGIGTTTFGTSAATVLGIKTGTAPSSGVADTIQLYSTDLSAGNTMLSIYTEGTCINSDVSGSKATATTRVSIRINGTVYYLLANTTA